MQYPNNYTCLQRYFAKEPTNKIVYLIQILEKCLPYNVLSFLLPVWEKENVLNHSFQETDTLI